MQLSKLMQTILYRGSYRLANNLNQKTIMTTPRRLQEILEDLKGNPYYDKYAEKISQMQKSAPEEFKSRVESVEKKKMQKIDATKERQYSQLLKPKESASTSAQAQEQPLDKIMKVDLIKGKTSEEVSVIWKEYHLQKECISATVPSADFKNLEENAKKYPTFLFPLPRSQGYEFIMCQFELNHVHFTPLLYFQVHKENAPECLTITHYKEFMDDKGIVLMRGEYDKNVLNAKEAQCLANQLQMYYIQSDGNKQKLLEMFTYNPDSFDHMDLVKEINNLELS